MDDRISGCTSMKLTSAEGNVYWFRTCDLKDDIWKGGAHMVSWPAGQEIDLEGQDQPLRSRYSFAGIANSPKDSWLMDGINEAGLIGGLQYLNEGTSAGEPGEGREGVVGMEVLTRLLAVCGTAEEVVRQAEDIQILDIPVGERKVPATMHYIFVDAKGKTAILEAADPPNPGILKAYRDRENIGVMANSPTYDRQLENLSWYMSQSPELRYGINGDPVSRLDFDGVEVRADETASHVSVNGSYPASFASCDRFIRAAMVKALNQNGRSFSDRQMLAFGAGLMHTVFEPHTAGIFHYVWFDEQQRPLKQQDSYTQYLIMYSAAERELYIQPYDSTGWTRLKLCDCPASRLERHPIGRSGMDGVTESRDIPAEG